MSNARGPEAGGGSDGAGVSGEAAPADAGAPAASVITLNPIVSSLSVALGWMDVSGPAG
jgi:hypothetical protein